MIVAADRLAGAALAVELAVGYERRRLGQDAALDLGRHAHLALETLFLEVGLEQPRALDLRRGDVRQRGEDLEVVAPERAQRVARVGVDQADHLLGHPHLGREPQRRAHRRAHAGRDQAVARLVDLVVEHVGDQQRDALFDDAAPDRAGDARDRIALAAARGHHLRRAACSGSSSTIAPRSTGTASKTTSSTRSNSSGSGRRPSSDELARLSSWNTRVWRGRSTTSTTRLVMRERSSSIL